MISPTAGVMRAAILSMLIASPCWAIDPDKLVFTPQDGFLRLPAGMEFGQCSAVDLDSRGNVYVIQRASPPVLCFSPAGEFQYSWGAQFIGREPDLRGGHGLRIDPADNVWITDRDRHLVRKFDRTGGLLLTLGTEDSPGTEESQFNRPADVAFGPDGAVYVADGYGNSRVVKFNSAGEFLLTWGSAGSTPGQFHLPHTIAVGPDHRVYVGDRNNDRIQVFNTEGELSEIWPGFVPCGIDFDQDGHLFVADGVSKVLQLSAAGKIIDWWGTEPEELGLTAGLRSVPPIENPGGFRFVPHLLAADRDGNLYLANVADRMIHKLIRTR